MSQITCKSTTNVVIRLILSAYPCTVDLRQGRFQDFFQGVAEISSEGGENLPGGGEKKLAAPPSPQRFFAFLHTIILIYAHFFNILDSCYKDIPT